MQNILLKIILITVIVLSAIGYVKFNRPKDMEYKPVQTDIKKDLIVEPEADSVLINGETFGYLIEKHVNPERIILGNNTTSKSDTQELMIRMKCIFGINGGFYDTQDRPLGWMVIDGKEVSRAKTSDLLNGFISIIDSQIEIGKLNNTIADYGVQSGPLLFSNSEPWTLKMARDEKSRRMVMGNTTQGVFILGIFDPEADLSGPYLADLPEVVQKIAEEEGLLIQNAINLDGGSASAIYTSRGNLKEISNAGSWWCVKNSF